VGRWVGGWCSLGEWVLDSGWVSGVDVDVLVTVCVLWCCQ